MPTPVPPVLVVARPVRRGFVVALVALVVTAFLAVGLAAVPAHAAGTGTLVVRVVTKAGTPVSGLSRTAIQAVPISNHQIDPFGSWVGGAPVTGKPGSYSFAVVADEDYTIQVIGAAGAYPQLYGGTAFYDTAKTVSVGDGAKTTLDFSVEANVTITGTVTGSSGKTAKGIRVTASRFDGSQWIDDWDAATTGSKGTYTLSHLDPGSYVLQYTDTTTVGYLPQTSKPIYLGVGQSIKATAKLSGGGRITSTAAFEYKGRYVVPAYGVQAVAYPVTYDGLERVIDKTHRYYGSVTGTDGHWVVGGLPAGQYIVRLHDVTPPGKYSLLPTYVLREPDVSDSTNKAQVFTVATGKTVTRHGYTAMGVSSYLVNYPLVLKVLSPAGDAITDNDTNLRVDATLESADSGDYFYSTAAAGAVRFTDSAGEMELRRIPDGRFTLTVTVSENGHPKYQPFVTTFDFSNSDFAAPLPKTIQLQPLTALGWSAAPTVSSPQLAAGTSNTVTATANQSGASVSYEWMRDGKPIYGATGASYTSTSGDIGRELSVAVFASKSDLDPVSDVVTVGTIIAGPQITAEAAGPVVSPAGAQPMGTTLAASPGDWSVPGVTSTIDWYSSADGYSAPIGTGATYTTQPADVGDSIRVQVVASKRGFTASVARFSAVVSVTPAAAPTLVTAPKVTYSKITNTYTVSTGTWSPATTSVDYAWTFDGNVVSEEDSLSIVNQDRTPITVTVAAHPAGHLASTPVTLVAYRGAATPSETSPGSIDTYPGGDPVVGSSGWGVTLDAGADPLTWTYPDGAGTNSSESTYQWYKGTYAKNAAIKGATKARFTPSSSYVGSSVFVVRSSTDPSWSTGTAQSPMVSISANTALADQPASVVITGSRAHSTLSVAVAGWSGATITRQWMTCSPAVGACTDPADYSPISKATASTYTTTYAQQGRQLIVKATAKRTGYVTATAFSAPVTLERGLAVLTKAPSVTTTQQKYTVSTGAWTPGTAESGTVSYQWFLDGSQVAANNDTPDGWQRNLGAGKTLVVVVTYTPVDTTIAPASTTVVVQKRASTDITTSSPTLHGSAFGDSFSLPGDPFSYTPSGTAHTLTYAWSVGGVVVKGATASTYTPAASAVGKAISLKVTSKAVGYPDASYTAPAVVLAAAPAASGSPVVTYTTDAPRPASVLTADVSSYDPAFALSYQWQSRSGSADWASISKATAATYSVPTTAPGSDLRVLVTAKRSGHSTVSTPSASVSVSYGPAIARTADPSVSGSGAVGSKLTASPGTWNTAGLSMTYQWMRAGVAIPGATATTFTPIGSSVGDDVWVVVTASRAGYQPVSAASSRVTVTTGAAPIATTAPKITGTPLIDSTLSVSTGAWSVDGLTFSYQWYEGDLAHPIDGATSNSYVPTDAPRSIFVVVTGTRLGYAQGSAASAAVTIRTQ